ncbi:helix-turn-helix transcriptional regulator [Caloranaerobacter sp. TR13]|uniref:helix-turn-helix transcriptional regulator n=1 Tax=Caloranaerobacter sp. TR13 TaxID=1302151 RepID=UPI0006D41AC1|nr:AraC family transcriptional regulator [Caloranaerobacter sp. TR13]
MNYYERIQRSLDYIEENLKSSIEIEMVAQESYMSISNFYRMFYALVGHTVKDYIRKRRLSCAANELLNTKKRIIDIALDYQYESQEAFTRAFRNYFEITPGRYRKLKKEIKSMERVNLMEKYFETHGIEDKYPDIKVLKELKPMRVAYYHAYGKSPEIIAITKVLNWAKRNNLLNGDNNHRYFGFDNPSPSPDRDEYGYEFGTHQCLEKHLLNDEDINEKAVDELIVNLQLDLYMPIKEG